MLFDRDAEWNALSSFATDDRLGARLALIYGRRRQGKTLLQRPVLLGPGRTEHRPNQTK